MRYCTRCGEPIAAHGARSVPTVLLKRIHSRARNLAEARSLTKWASRVCPVVDDPDGRVMRPKRLAEYQVVEERKAA